MSPEYPVDAEAEALLGLRSDDERRRERVVEELYKMLVKAAASDLGAVKSRQVHTQPESIVQSILVDALPAAQRTCRSDKDLRNYLRAAVRNRIRDRVKGPRGRVVQGSQLDPDDGAFEVTARQAGPGSMIVERESRERAAASDEKFIATLMAVAVDDDERRIFRRFLTEGRSWEETIQGTSMTVVAARQKLSRRRRSLIEQLINPLRETLDGTSWAILDGVLVRGLPVEQISPLVGFSKDEVAQRLLASLLNAYGVAGLKAMKLLLPKALAG